MIKKHLPHLAILLAGGLLLVLIGVFGHNNNASAAAKTWTGATDTDWNTAANWNGSALPVNGDDITVPGSLGNYPTISSASAFSVHNLVVQNGASLTITSGGSVSTTGNPNINSGGTLSVAGTLTLGATNNLTNSGTLTISSGTTTVHDLSGAGIASMSGGTLQVSHDFKPTPANFSATGGTVEFTGTAGPGAFPAGTYQFYNVLLTSGDPGFNKHSTTIGITSDLSITGGVATFSGSSNTADTLTLSGEVQSAGTWGSTSSSALNTNDTYFSGTGVITIASSTPTVSTGNVNGGGIGKAEDHAPVLTVLGDNPMMLTVGDKFTDPGATANDYEQGNLTSSITTLGMVDTTKVGSYQITYNIQDEWLVGDEKARIVVVSEKPEEPKVAEEPAVKAECKALLTEYIKFGAQNNSDQVKLLENFLNTHEGTTLAVDGTYKKADLEAVKAFQQKYIEILKDWGLTQPTGYVYKSTIKVINRLACENQ